MKKHTSKTVEVETEEKLQEAPSQSPWRLFMVAFGIPLGLIVLFMFIQSVLGS